MLVAMVGPLDAPTFVFDHSLFRSEGKSGIGCGLSVWLEFPTLTVRSMVLWGQLWGPNCRRWANPLDYHTYVWPRAPTRMIRRPGCHVFAGGHIV